MAEVEIVFDDRAMAELFESTEGPVAKDLVRRGLKVQRLIIELVHRHGTGRVYKRRGITHQASAPGEPPAADTGLYGATIQQQLERDGGGLVEKIGTNDKRGVWLEKGTRTMAPRPHLVPGLDAARD